MSRVALLMLCACAAAQVRRDVPAGPVDGPTAKQLVADGARLVDVRAPDYYAKGHIEGAINIPWQQIEVRAEEIGPITTPIVLYCRTGQGAANAYATLTRIGYRRVYVLGSYLNWGEGAPAPTPLPAATTMPQDACPAGPPR
ncbi:MAG TPA: rhodanese-like domain-containing protein [Myxococcales bacterium]|nr:rhodanese-like domain-containing protein [Myxococcales bacterium]